MLKQIQVAILLAATQPVLSSLRQIVAVIFVHILCTTMASRILSLNRVRVLSRNNGIARRAVNTNSGTDKFDKVNVY